MKFLIHSDFGELHDLADYLKNVEGHEVVLYIPSPEEEKIGDGIVPKTKEWYKYLGKGYVWIVDGCSHGEFQDWLREKGEAVFGGSKMGDELENNRQMGQKWFKAAGFNQVESHNFTTINEALAFVKSHTNKKWILKQNGGAPKSINHKGKFDDGRDMIFHLETLKLGWNESEYGSFDCDLMEVVEGMEVAASVLFNGKDFMKNKEGKVVGWLNFEEKKESNENMGETVGEMGTTFIGVTEDNKLFKDIIMRPKILQVLRESKFRGVFDINTIKTKDGIVALEPTCRPGIPSTSYEFMEGLDMNSGKMIESVARGLDTPIEVRLGVGMVICIVAKPFPVEANVDKESTSQGEKLWILKDGKIKEDFDKEQRKHIHLYNFERSDKDDRGVYRVSTKNGYLLTITASGESVAGVRYNLMEYIKDNIYIPNMKFRTDIGNRLDPTSVKNFKEIERVKEETKKEYEEKAKKIEEKYTKEVEEIKKGIRDIIYEPD